MSGSNECTRFLCSQKLIGRQCHHRSITFGMMEGKHVRSTDLFNAEVLAWNKISRSDEKGGVVWVGDGEGGREGYT